MRTRTLRIVHVVCTDAFAGVERYVSVLARSQIERGHRVVVIGGDPQLMREALAPYGAPFVEAGTVRAATVAVDRWRHCDVIHAHMTAAEVATLLAARSWRVPVVASRHFGQRRGASLPGRVIAPAVAARVRAQIAVSSYVASRIEGSSVVIHPGVESPPESTPAARRSRVVLVAQRLEAEKATGVGIAAFARSGLSASGWQLHLAGDGSERAKLERTAERLGVADAVRFLGFRSDVPDLMQQAAILLATSPAEHFGLSVVEAMGARLPVVAVGAAGHLETVGAVPGSALFPVGDVDAAACLLAGLAADPVARDSYGMRLQGVQREQFSLERQADAVDRVYEGLL